MAAHFTDALDMGRGVDLAQDRTGGAKRLNRAAENLLIGSKFRRVFAQATKFNSIRDG